MLYHSYQENLHDKYNKYALGFFLCELANLVVLVVQVHVTDRSGQVHLLVLHHRHPRFLSGQFLSYGPRVWDHLQGRGGPSPTCEVFPRVATCSYVR